MESQRPPKALLWTGRVLSALPVLMMAGIGTLALVHPSPEMVEGFRKHGYPDSAFKPILIVEICSALIYAIPQTSVVGAILLTGYLGGAVATHVRAGEPNWFVPVIVGVIVWLGLLLRDRRLWSLLPFRKL